jgi:hypothetical protein
MIGASPQHHIRQRFPVKPSWGNFSTSSVVSSSIRLRSGRRRPMVATAIDPTGREGAVDPAGAQMVSNLSVAHVETLDHLGIAS